MFIEDSKNSLPNIAYAISILIKIGIQFCRHLHRLPGEDLS